ncbi:MAG: AzlC family ABC transporter permease [Gaiellales bacterium]|nr:AzlC family ABC transporter permease [Gaiellales bacterium]
MAEQSPQGAGTGREIREGMKDAVPVVLGYVPIGIAYGILGVSAGVPAWGVIGMSVMVFAGSAQLVGVSLLGAGVTPLTLLATTLLLNLRHLLYSSALVPKLQKMPKSRLAWLAAELTDETFVMATRAAERRGRLSFPFVAGLNGVSQLSWIAGSTIGALAGSLVGDPARLGLDYALTAMFIGLLALQLHGRRELVVAGVAAMASLALAVLGVGAWGALVATLAASVAGTLLPGKEDPLVEDPARASADDDVGVRARGERA